MFLKNPGDKFWNALVNEEPHALPLGSSSFGLVMVQCGVNVLWGEVRILADNLAN